MNILPALIGGLMLSGMTVRAGDIPSSAQDVRPLLIGSAVPDVTLKTADGTDFSLRAAVAKKPSILIFYRGGWCPYCNLHLGQLQTAEPELLKLGYQILAISPDRPEKVSEGAEKVNYTLLSDASMTAAKAFGIAFRVDDGTLDKYKGYGIDLEAASGQKHHLLPVPAVFVAGADGRIHFVYVNPDYKIRLAPEVLLAAARASIAKDESEKDARGRQ
jgi:peroxiredoxin